MNENEEDFPFQQMVESLQGNEILENKLKNILKAVQSKNMYWIYSCISTLVQLFRSKEEEPLVKFNTLKCLKLLFETCQYAVITLIEVYVLPIVVQIANFKLKKTDQAAGFYFIKQGYDDSIKDIKQIGQNYVLLAVQFIFFSAKIKPFRTCQIEQLKQQSNYSRSASSLKEKGIDQPSPYKFAKESSVKELRKKYLLKLKNFEEDSEVYAEFFLYNILEQVKSGKKELLELKQLLHFGDCYLTSLLINVCQDQLNDMSEKIQVKRKFLLLLNEMVRWGDIEAIIMIKNSDFITNITANICNVQGHISLAQGENIYPEISSKKQDKKDFYTDFLRCIDTWALSMPPEHDNEQFTLQKILDFLKVEKKFKFPQNLHLQRFQKQLKENLEKNKQRNDKLVHIMENMQSSKYTSMERSKTKYSKVSNILGKPSYISSLPIVELQKKVDEAKRMLTELGHREQEVEGIMAKLIFFKDNWINYLDSLNLEDDKNIDGQKLDELMNDGEKFVQQIQMIIPLHTAFTKGKINFKQFKSRLLDSLNFHNEISINKSKNSRLKAQLSNSISISKKRSSIGKELLSKIKGKSRMDNSRMDRSKMQKSIRNAIVEEKEDKIIQKEIKKEPQNNFPANFKREIKQQSLNTYKNDSQSKKSISSRHISQEQIKSPKKQQQIRDRRDQGRRTEKINRINDYENESVEHPDESKITRRSQSRGSRSSRLLIKINNNQNEARQKSIKSKLEEDKKSLSGRKSVKETSIFKKNSSIQKKQSNDSVKRIENRIQQKGKVSQIEEQLKEEIAINQTIQINGNIIKSNVETEKNKKINDEENDRFQDVIGEISSIHSNSMMKVFHHSAEKIFNPDRSEINASRSLRKDGSNANRRTKVIIESDQKNIKTTEVLPLVGDYYEQKAETITSRLQHKKIKKEQFDEQDFINKPELAPMRHSYLMNEGQYRLNQGQKDNPQFKTVFTGKYDGFESRQKEQKLIKNTKEENFKIMIKQSNAKNSRVSTQNVFSVLPKHDNLKILQAKMIEEEKNKQIQLLQKKIRQLEQQTKAMKTKLAAKDNELKSIRSQSKNGSERGFVQFTSPSQSNYYNASDGLKARSEKNSLTLKGSEVNSQLVLASNFKKEIQSTFKQYLQRIKGNTFRKSLLKLKCLVHKNEQIQIGCLSNRVDKTLQITLYITPHRYDLLDFTIAVLNDNNLRSKIFPEQIKIIPIKKQQKVHVTIEVLRIPFCIPEFQINYKAKTQYSSNYFRLAFPLSFNKFCEADQLDTETFLKSRAGAIQNLRSDDFKLNLKIAKLDKIKDSFPNFGILNLPGLKKGELSIGSRIRYGESIFDIVLLLGEKGSWIEGYLLIGENKPLHFMVCTLKEILDSSKK